MTVCYECGKGIKGTKIQTVPSILAQILKVDFPKAFHPGCYQKAEEKAARELGIQTKGGTGE